MKMLGIFGKIAVTCAAGLILLSLAVIPETARADSYCGSPGNPSVQLLPSIGLGVLRDTFCNNGLLNPTDIEPQLTIVNRTNATLNVQLYSTGGTKYDLKLAQGMNDTWTINPGTYRSELIIPGFPSLSGAQMNLQNGHTYRWVIRRSEL